MKCTKEFLKKNNEKNKLVKNHVIAADVAARVASTQ